VYPKDSGTIRIAGHAADIRSPHDALRAGVSMIFQETTLAKDLTVAENIFLGMEPERGFGVLDNAAIRRRAQAILEGHGFAISASTYVERLTRAEKQMVEIARALTSASRVVVMDEPTAMLSHRESEELFRIIGELKAKGLAVIYISHRLEELARISERITILRNGVRVYTGPYHSVDRPAIIRHMVGRDITELFPKLSPPSSEVVLEARFLGDRLRYKNVSFEVHRGEVLGFGGLVGAGRTEMVRGIFGLEPFVDGALGFDGKIVRFSSPGEAIAAGFGFLTEDRKTTGIFPELSIAHNISMAALDRIGKGGTLNVTEEIGRCRELMRSLDVRARSERQPIYRLSGGNQQKAIFARWLFAGSKILLLDEPTQGVDVGARTEIYNLIKSIAERGAAVIMVSSDLPELIGMSHRIAVMRGGELVATLDSSRTNQEEIMHYAALERV
jgi:ABC-type sugar transport system ATPase subunit